MLDFLLGLGSTLLLRDNASTVSRALARAVAHGFVLADVARIGAYGAAVGFAEDFQDAVAEIRSNEAAGGDFSKDILSELRKIQTEAKDLRAEAKDLRAEVDKLIGMRR